MARYGRRKGNGPYQELGYRADSDHCWRSVDWSAHTRRLRLAGRHVQYVDIGSGPTIVLIHGQGGSWQWWLRNLPELAGCGRVIAIDLPGFGGSDPAVGRDVIGGHAGTVVGVLDYLGLPEATVVGHSMGGLVAHRIAADHPGRVSGLALVNAGGANLGAVRLALIVALFHGFNALFSIGSVPRAIAMRPLLRRAMFAAAVQDHYSLSTPLALQIIPQMASPGFMPTLRAGARVVRTLDMSDVKCACVVIWGGRDRILPLSTGERLSESIRNSRLAVIDGAGHCVMFEAPADFNRTLIDFVEDLGARGIASGG